MFNNIVFLPTTENGKAKNINPRRIVFEHNFTKILYLIAIVETGK